MAKTKTENNLKESLCYVDLLTFNKLLFIEEQLVEKKDDFDFFYWNLMKNKMKNIGLHFFSITQTHAQY